MDIATNPNMDSHDQFSTLLQQHRKILLKVARTYAWHADDRADLGQEIAAQLWRAYPHYDPQRTFSTWMYRIALNVAISWVRSNSRRQQHNLAFDDALHDVADDVASPESVHQVRELRRFIASLEPLNRALLLLYLEEHSYREIADIVGISESNVATKISRLKQRVRDELTGNHA
ncbi:MAG: sigma-70 family RNA polymerase sigma factor [Dokdonella sp.]